MNYKKEARSYRNQANALSLLEIVLLAVGFYAITNDPLRAIIGTLAFGMFSAVVSQAENVKRAAEIMEANALTDDVTPKQDARHFHIDGHEVVAGEYLKDGDLVTVIKARKAAK